MFFEEELQELEVQPSLNNQQLGALYTMVQNRDVIDIILDRVISLLLDKNVPVNHRDIVLDKIAVNRNATAIILERIFSCTEDLCVYRSIVNNPNVAHETIMEVIKKVGNTKSNHIWEQILRNNKINDIMLNLLLDNYHVPPHDFEYIPTNTNASTTTLIRLIELINNVTYTGNINVLIKIAIHPNVPIDNIIECALRINGNEGFKILSALAVNKNYSLYHSKFVIQKTQDCIKKITGDDNIYDTLIQVLNARKREYRPLLSLYNSKHGSIKNVPANVIEGIEKFIPSDISPLSLSAGSRSLLPMSIYF